MVAGRGLKGFACWLASLVLAFGLLLPLPAGRAEDHEVDLALVLAIDCSFSVDAREFALQMEGLGRAFMSSEVKEAIAQGPRQRIAIAAVQWSDDRSQKTVLQWTLIASGADADRVGQELLNMPRSLSEGGTSISAALLYSATLLQSAPSAERLVIDVSADGRNNSGPQVRDRLVAAGITINGLTILNEWPTLDSYFESNVAGGPGHFVVPAADYDAYGEAILRKLLREIAGPGIT
jgi:hypothetical protein